MVVPETVMVGSVNQVPLNTVNGEPSANAGTVILPPFPAVLPTNTSTPRMTPVGSLVSKMIFPDEFQTCKPCGMLPDP